MRFDHEGLLHEVAVSFMEGSSRKLLEATPRGLMIDAYVWMFYTRARRINKQV